MNVIDSVTSEAVFLFWFFCLSSVWTSWNRTSLSSLWRVYFRVQMMLDFWKQVLTSSDFYWSLFFQLVSHHECDKQSCLSLQQVYVCLENLHKDVNHSVAWWWCVSVFVPRTTAAAAAAAAIGPYAVRGIAEETEKIKRLRSNVSQHEQNK